MQHQPTHRVSFRAASLGVWTLSLISALVASTPALGQITFGTNSGAFADYLQSNGMTDLPLRGWGTAANPFSSDPSVVTANNTLIANGGTVTYAQNYASGAYTISFNSPSAVTISTAGFFGAPTNVTRNGTLETMTVQLTHDGGNPLAGMGWLTTSGVSSSNPVSNFQIVQQGQTGGNLTSTFTNMTGKYQAIRWMNNLGINNNSTLQTSASMLPSGSNFGTQSPDDIVKWANQQSNLKTLMVNIPVNADASYVAAFAQKMNALDPSKQLVVEYGNEDWNFTFSHTGWLMNQARADSQVTATDDFGKLGQEVGLRATAMMNVFLANSTNKTRVAGFLGSQGSNTYFVDQQKAAITRVYGASTLTSDFKYQGISFYPGDGLKSASSVQDLYNQLEADLTRLKGFLVADRNDASASSMKELVYEWSPNGYLTQGGVSQAIIDAFRADPLSKQLTLDTWNAIAANIGAGGMAFSFDVTGDGWSTQINPAGATEQEQLAINQISAALGVGSPSVGTGAPVPEPTSIGLLALGGIGLLARRRRA